MKGRRRDSNHLKLVRGTARPSRISPSEVQFAPVATEIPAPEWLNVHARRYWRDLVPKLQARRVLTEVDLEGLAVGCSAYGKIVQMAIAGESVNAALLNCYRAFLVEFGLTPASRGRIIQASDAKKDNPFTQNRRETPTAV